MTKNSNTPHTRHPLRAVLKMAAIIVGLLAVAGVLLLTIDDSVLDQLKFNLSLGTLIVLVVVINIISFVFFMILYAAYQWVRRDLKGPRSEDMADEQGDL